MTEEKTVPFLDLAGVAPSPSRDYYRIYVTKSEVALTQWRISHGPRSVPIELKIPLESFEKDVRIPSEVSRVFGKECVDYIVGLSHGHVDKIMHLPTHLLAYIFQCIGIEHLTSIAPVCSKFANICRSDELWKRFYIQYGGDDAIALETKHQAEYLTWKSLFFINRLHYKIGNAERFPGIFAEHKMNILSKTNRRRIEGHPSSTPSNTYIGSSSTLQSHRRVATKLAQNPTKESNSTRGLVRTRTTKLSDGLAPRASTTKIKEHSKKGMEINTPRQQATRYTLLNIQESIRKNPSPKYNL